MPDRRIVVIGAGIAGLSAALAARDSGAEVVVLECASVEERGGNTRFSNGALRYVRTADESGGRALTREQFLEDMLKVTRGRTDRALAELMIDRSAETIHWLDQTHDVRPGTSPWNRGAALSDSLFAAAERQGIEVRYDTRAASLLQDDGGVSGVVTSSGGARKTVDADAVVVAAGGFEANPEWRARYLGPRWDLVKVRGSRFNTGDGLRMAMQTGAMPFGHWSGCHSTNWDLNAPDQNNLALNTVFKRDSFNHGIIVNTRGERFFDEGGDFGGLIYASLGPVILAQPGGIVWQIYDAQSSSLLLPEYHADASSKIVADTIPELAAKLLGIDEERFIATVREFNDSVDTSMPFQKDVKDGRCTHGLTPPKSNWARAIIEPPFEAYPCTTGITFTFGGVRIDEGARVLDVDGRVIRGLYTAGEMVGGLFYYNYPGGAGLTSAAVFGRIAGCSAATDT